MAEPDWREGCRILEEYIEKKKEYLEEISKVVARERPSRLNRADVEKATPAAAVQTLRKRLVYLQSQLELFSGPIRAYPQEKQVVANIAKIQEKTLAFKLQELLVAEKRRQTELNQVKANKIQIIAERKKVLATLTDAQKSLESKSEELEKAKIKELEEQLATVRRKYGEMKVHLKSTVEKLFPEPVKGYLGMYAILNVLTQPLQNRERETYIKLTNTMWPFYIELLERHGIIEYHPTDKEKIRIVDFSDGSLGG